MALDRTATVTLELTGEELLQLTNDLDTKIAEHLAGIHAPGIRLGEPEQVKADDPRLLALSRLLQKLELALAPFEVPTA